MDVPVFTISADPTCMYQTPAIREAVAKIRMAIAHRQGLSCIFGDIGFGKSSLLRYIGSAYDADEQYRVASVPPKWASMAPYGFLSNLCKELEIPTQRSTSAQMDALESFLIEQHRSGNTVIVMIDEAQLLRLECMELIRALLNYETHTEKLCQVILAGQLELRNRLLTKKYKAFKSRIVAPVVLEVFTAEETEGMMAMRHEHWMVPNRFTHEACLKVHELSCGVPRDIVQICRYACLIADERKLAKIVPDTVEEAFSKLSVSSERETAEAVATV